jgi:lysophospholipase L1-like esterase
MKRIIFILLISFILASCNTSSNNSDNKEEIPDTSSCKYDSIEPIEIYRSGISPIVSFIGDSRAYGGGTYDALSYEIHNFGVGGSTIYGALGRLDRAIATGAQYIVIFTGANDPAYMDIYVFKAKLTELKKKVEGKKIHLIVMDQTVNPQYDNSYFYDFRIAMESIAGADYLAIDYDSDCWASGDAGNVHLNNKGYALVCTAIKKYINNIK